MLHHRGLFGRIDQDQPRGGLDQVAADVTRTDIPDIVEDLERRHLLEFDVRFAALAVDLAHRLAGISRGRALGLRRERDRNQ